MLTRLHLRDFVIAHDIDLDLGPGLTCFTGETGAGKSLLAQALGLALGGRAAGNLVRAGPKRAVVEALFDDAGGEDLRARLGAIGLEEENELVVRREIGADGRTRVSVNGSPVTVRMLRTLTSGLVEITGQGEHHALLRPSTHEALLDASGELANVRARVTDAYRTYARAAEALRKLALDERDRLSRQDLLRFQLDEIAAADLDDEGELDRIDAERTRLRSAEKLRHAAFEAASDLYERDGAAADLIGRAANVITEAATLDPDLSTVATELETARAMAAEAARELERYAARISSDPGRLDLLEERADLLRRLCRKHGGDLVAVTARSAEMQQELDKLEQHDDELAALETSLAAARETGVRAARALTRAREKKAPALSRAVTKELASLGMAEARFTVRVEPRPAPSTHRGDGDGDELDDGVIPPLVCDGARVGPTGRDRVSFILAPNPGESAGPLARIASGGERSRVALAVSLVLADRDPAATYVLDEVDVGVGGRTATALAERLQAASRHRQMLCITHQAQLAAVADTHFKVDKQVGKNTTRAVVRSLEPEQRTEEIARMLGGARVTARTRAHAQEMLRR